MSSVESLRAIENQWVQRVALRLGREEGVRAIFTAQLHRFYAMMIQAVVSGDPGCMDTVLDEWVQGRTQSDLESRESSVLEIFDHILVMSEEIAQELLDERAALEVVRALIPVYNHVYRYTSQREMNLYLDRMAADLDEARLRLERLDRSKSDFIAIAAHELKTPLTLIEGYSSMLREYLAKEAEAVAPLLKGIDSGAVRLREIVDDMIDVSLIDNDLLSLSFQPVWIGQLLKIVLNEFEETIQQRVLEVELCAFPGRDEMTFGDSERLYQAFRNVISNAIKYTPDGGQIIVDGRKLPGFLEVTVSDTGIGVDPGFHTRIFEKFGRLGDAALHSSGKTKFKGGGPGLGLPITKGIVEAHGGAIWVESEGYDEANCPGSIFHILLPLRSEPPDEKLRLLFGSAEMAAEERRR